MHTLARPPVRKAGLKRQTAFRAFTLIELLTVIAIIAILAAITFGVVKNVNEKAAIGKAKAELSSLAQALEAFKLQYGDYPQAGLNAADATATTVSSQETQYILFNCLVGKMGPKGNRLSGRNFVETERFSLLTDELPEATGNQLVNNAFVDPWGRMYIYYYRKPENSPSLKWPSYILFSAGPDGITGITLDPDAETGEFKADAPEAADNVYSNPI